MNTLTRHCSFDYGTKRRGARPKLVLRLETEVLEPCQMGGFCGRPAIPFSETPRAMTGRLRRSTNCFSLRSSVHAEAVSGVAHGRQLQCGTCSPSPTHSKNLSPS